MPISYSTSIPFIVPGGTTTSSTASFNVIQDSSRWSTQSDKSKYKVGDEVVVVNKVYHWTTPGSCGTIIKILPDYKVKIKWDKILGLKGMSTISQEEYMRRSIDWEISMFDIELVKENNVPYFKVIRKIKQMDERRKEQGYAF